MRYLKTARMLFYTRSYADTTQVFVSDDSISGGSKMHIYSNLIVLGIGGIALLGLSSVQLLNPALSFMVSAFIYGVLFAIAFSNTKMWVKKEHSKKIEHLKTKYENKIKKLKYEHDAATLEKTIRDGTKTLIKNAVDYFKIENIKNEMPPSAAIQNLQLDKYGQIIELLADFSLILPDYEENQRIVQQEICHQIEIFMIDEKPFADFLRTVMGKYLLTLNKKLREKRKKGVEKSAQRSRKKFYAPITPIVAGSSQNSESLLGSVTDYKADDSNELFKNLDKKEDLESGTAEDKPDTAIKKNLQKPSTLSKGVTKSKSENAAKSINRQNKTYTFSADASVKKLRPAQKGLENLNKTIITARRSLKNKKKSSKKNIDNLNKTKMPTVHSSAYPGISGANPDANEDEYSQYIKKGFYEHKIKNYREAIRLFTLAIDLNPEGEQAYYNRGVSLRKMNQNEMALKDLEEASRLGHDKARQMINLIKLSETQEWDNIRDMLNQHSPSS